MKVSKINRCFLFVVFSSLLLFNSTPLSGGKTLIQLTKKINGLVINSENTGDFEPIFQLFKRLANGSCFDDMENFLPCFTYFLYINGHKISSSKPLPKIFDANAILKKPIPVDGIIKISMWLAKELPLWADMIIEIVARCPKLFWNNKKSIAKYAKDFGLNNKEVVEYLTNNSRKTLKKLFEILKTLEPTSKNYSKNIEKIKKCIQNQKIDVNLVF